MGGRAFKFEGVIQKFRVGVILCSVLPNDKLVAYRIENIIPNLPSDRHQAALQTKNAIRAGGIFPDVHISSLFSS